VNQSQRRLEALAAQVARLREHMNGLHRDYADLFDSTLSERPRATFAQVVELLASLERDLGPPTQGATQPRV
jgi:hypothetical protein